MGAWRCNILARLRVLYVGFLGIGAAALNTVKVTNVHVGEGTKLVRTAADIDIGAVHVKLAVAKSVGPGPRHRSLAALKLLGNLEGEGIDAFGLAKGATRGGIVQVALGNGWAASLDGVDDVPVGWIFDLLGVSLVGDRDLARSTTMDGSVGTTTKLEAEVLSGTDRPGSTSRRSKACTVAGKVATARVNWVLDVVVGHWWGVGHDHMGSSSGSKAEH